MSKVSLKDIFARFRLTVFGNKLTFMKKAVPYTTTLIHCKARLVLCDLFSTNQSKINLKNLKTWLGDVMQATILRH